MLRALLSTCAVLLAGIATCQAAAPLPLRDGDVVALVGNTFIEREQRDGFIELALTLAAPDANVAFRNLGWSGDTVDGRARRYFGPTPEGFNHLLTHLDVVKPTVIIVSYGTNEAFDGEAGRAAFQQGYEKLIAALRERTDRIMIVSSPPLDPTASPAPEIARRVNAELAWQAGWLREVADSQEFGFVDLTSPLAKLIADGNAPVELTDNGMHLTPAGYRVAGKIILDQSGLSGQWYENLADAAKPLPEAQERLRTAIRDKNTLFFHRHRPQNETYLRGFRKHEQGNNAVEIFAFEPLVSEQDRAIFALRKAAAGK